MPTATTFLLTYSIKVVGGSNYSSMVMWHDVCGRHALHDLAVLAADWHNNKTDLC